MAYEFWFDKMADRGQHLWTCDNCGTQEQRQGIGWADGPPDGWVEAFETLRGLERLVGHNCPNCVEITGDKITLSGYDKFSVDED